MYQFSCFLQYFLTDFKQIPIYFLIYIIFYCNKYIIVHYLNFNILAYFITDVKYLYSKILNINNISAAIDKAYLLIINFTMFSS